MSLPRRSVAGAGDKSKPARWSRDAGAWDVAGTWGGWRWDLSSCHPVPVAPAHVSLKAEQTNGASQTARRDAAADGTRGGAGAVARRARWRRTRARGAGDAGGCRGGGYPPLGERLYLAPPSRGQRGMVLVNDKAAMYDAGVDRVLTAWHWYTSTTRGRGGKKYRHGGAGA